MKKTTRMAVIDMAFAKAFGLNMNLGAVYNVLRFAPTYCKAKEIEGETYYFISRNLACEKLSLITDKPDTMYRYYKKLEASGLVKLHKIGAQDYVHIVPEHAIKWNSDDYPNLGRSSEQLGQPSENTPKNSDERPTYIRVIKKEDKGKVSGQKPATDLDQLSIESQEQETAIANFLQSPKVRRKLTPHLPDGHYLPEVAKEIGRAFTGDSKTFNPNHGGSCRGMETWAMSYVKKMKPVESQAVQPQQSSTAYERITKAYTAVTGCIVSPSQHKYIAPIIRDYITKPGITYDQIKTAFSYLPRTRGNYENLDHVLKNIPQLLEWQKQHAA